MYGTWNTRMLNTYFAPDGDGGGGTGGEGGTTPPEGGGTGTVEKTFTQAEVNAMVQGRVGETKRSTEEAVAKDLGVSLEEAKRIIKASQDAADKDLTEAQLARKKADEEAAASKTAQEAAAKERHDAAVERALLRALPKDLEDEDLDKKLARVTRMLDVEVGADAAAITKAVADLKKDEPLLFGASDGDGKGGGAPDSDIKGKPAPRKGSEDAFARGQERAKAATGKPQYPLLSNT
jgi:hypothetical protein